MKQDNALIILTGAYGNLGDAVIRRRALEWARPYGNIHAYVSNAPDGWIQEVGLSDEDVLYDASGKGKWILKAIFDKSVVALFLDPGQVPLGRKHIPSESALLLVSLFLRMRGALIVRPPRSVSVSSQLCLLIHRLGCRLSDVVLWRTEQSMSIVKVGELSPDIAFAEPRTSGVPWEERKLLVVSMRGKRAFPSASWFESVAGIATAAGLDIRVVTQVREDESRSREIAEKLGAQLHRWEDIDDVEHEVRIRQLYQSTAFAISDRLHVLILATMAGAVPLELSDHPVPKVMDTFSQVGLDEVVFDTSSGDPLEAINFAMKAGSNRDKLMRTLEHAQSRLQDFLIRIKNNA